MTDAGGTPTTKIVLGSPETTDRFVHCNAILGLLGAIRMKHAASVSYLELTSPHFKKTLYILTVSNFKESLCYAPNAM
jgi:hypothetical protein